MCGGFIIRPKLSQHPQLVPLYLLQVAIRTIQRSQIRIPQLRITSYSQITPGLSTVETHTHCYQSVIWARKVNLEVCFVVFMDFTEANSV